MTLGIIGSGPCGAIAALYLLRRGESVELLDITDSNNQVDVGFLSNIKLLNGSNAPYDLDQYLQISHLGDINFFPSKIRSGFSTVWGATWGRFRQLNDSQWIGAYESADRYVFGELEELSGQTSLGSAVKVETICGCFESQLKELDANKSQNTSSFKRSTLAANTVYCDCLQNGLGACSHGSIWNTENILKACATYPKFNYVAGYFAESIRVENNSVAISNVSEIRNFEKVILAAGPIGNAALLLKSGLGADELTLLDTQMYYLPLWRFKRAKKHSGSFSLSQIQGDFTFSNSGLSAHLQIYAHTENFADRIKGKMPAVIWAITKYPLRLIYSHLSIGILYLDSKVSSKVRLSLNQKLTIIEEKVIPSNIELSDLRLVLRKSLRPLKLLPIFSLLSKSGVGESYHLGAEQSGLCDEYGRLVADKRIGVAGSFALPHLEPGPITNTTIAQTIRLVENF